jgi:hypothetical protein
MSGVKKNALQLIEKEEDALYSVQKKYRMKKCTQRQHRLRKRSVQKQWPLLAYLSKKYQRSLRERSKNDHEVIPIRTNDAEKTPL